MQIYIVQICPKTLVKDCGFQSLKVAVAVVSSQSSIRKLIELAGFTSSLVQFTSFNDAKISKKSEKLFLQKSFVQKSRESKCIFHGSRKNRKPVSRGRKNIDSRITEKINPHSRFTQSKNAHSRGTLF